jgi:transposase
VDKILRLERAARRRLINRGRKTKDPHTALRFLMIAKLGQGLSRQQVARDLACVPSTVVRTARRFAEFGEDGLLDQRAFNGVTKADDRFREELSRVPLSLPTEFGWQRPTWTRELLCLELERRGQARVAACTMGRALSALGTRLGMPKPTVLCPWDRSAGCAFSLAFAGSPGTPRPRSRSSTRTRWTSISTRRSAATGCCRATGATS